MKLKEIFRNSASGETITADTLRKIPHLKTCFYWDRATFLGWVSCRLQFANYDGGLVKYENRIYYMNRSQIEALGPWTRWDLRKKVTVVQD